MPNLMMSACRHQFREYNSAPDRLANAALTSNTSIFNVYAVDMDIGRFRVRFDGACRGNPGEGSAAWVLYGSSAGAGELVDEEQFFVMYECAFLLGQCTSTEAELIAAHEAVKAVESWSKFRHIAIDGHGRVALAH